MPLVDTIMGPVERDLLEVTDIVMEESNARVIVTEWRLKGELVKRDCHVAILHGQSLGGAQAQM